MSSSEWLREKSFSLRGFHEEDFKEEEHEEPEHNYAKRNSTQLPKKRVRQKDARTIPPRGYEWAQLGGTVVRIIINYTLYVSCTLTSLRGMLNHGLFDCSDTRLFGNNQYYDYDITVRVPHFLSKYFVSSKKCHPLKSPNIRIVDNWNIILL